MKVLVGFQLLVTLATVLCDKFDDNEVTKAQTQLIETTVTELKEWANNKLSAPFKIYKCINDNLDAIDKLMMEEADRRQKQGLTLLKDIFEHIHEDVYQKGRRDAIYKDSIYYTWANSTDGTLGLAKFCLTSVVIRWRCELDQERRTVHPVHCKDEQGSWNTWNNESKIVVDTLIELIPKLHEIRSEYWAYQHQKMLDYIIKGINFINNSIKAEPSEEKRVKYLCLLTEDLHLLNIVASTRPPVE